MINGQVIEVNINRWSGLIHNGINYLEWKTLSLVHNWEEFLNERWRKREIKAKIINVSDYNNVISLLEFKRIAATTGSCHNW